jgi:hypothetical protein
MDISWEFTVLDITVMIGIVLIVVLFVVVKFFSNSNKLPSDIDRKFYQDRWKKIEELMSYGKEMNYKLAVIEADKLLDDCLKSMRFQGGTMAERLKFASYKFTKLKHVWWAHKVRNKIVHETRYTLRHGEAKKVLTLFRQALKLLGVL